MVTLITGDKDTGKTSFLLNWYNQYPLGVALLTVKHFQNKELTGYDLLLLPEGKAYKLCRTLSHIKELPVDEYSMQGSFFFDENVFEAAALYMIDNYKEGDPVWIDEIGILEINDRGFYSLLQYFLKKNATLNLGVRECVLPLICKWFEPGSFRIIHFQTEAEKECRD